MIRLAVAILLSMTLLLSACSSWSPEKDPRVYKSSYKLTSDGHYRVRRGDTLHAIAFNFGLDWRDIAAWNNIRSPYTIYPDQEIKISGPKRTAAKPLTTRSAPPRAASTSAGTDSRTAKSSSGTSTKSTSRPAAGKSVALPDPGKWLWPTEGRLVSSFKANDPARNGIDIGGKEGQSIKATASGEIVYSGSGLIGYGELIIIKHSERMLSAYAHNRKRLVKEGQSVTAGQRIAEMGRNDRNQALLHFEIRVNGSPRDPMDYLPGR